VSLDHIHSLRESAPAKELDTLLRPTDAALVDRQPLELTDSLSWYFLRGQPVTVSGVLSAEVGEGDMVRVFRAPGEFLGLGEVLEDGRIKPHRLVRSIGH